MPHQCTDCGHTFPDGSKEMLSGCPDCGGNKFRFEPAADARELSAARSADETTDAATPDIQPNNGPAATQPPPADSPPDEPAVTAETEDSAQADARRDVASPDELAAGAEESGSAGETTPSSDAADADDSGEDSEMAALRQELDDQFESIKILEPGQYELNLMELYNREEYIIALQEDGQYVIEVPESWHG
jgi:predicted  nucleic acid-binding Zn-ribbon protein